MKFLSLVISAAFATSVVATPPACLLACVNKIVKQSECSGMNDLSCICSKKYHDIEDCLSSTCPNNPSDSGKDASSSLESTCKGQRKSVGNSSSSLSNNSSSSETSFSKGSSAPSLSTISSSSPEGLFTILPVSSGPAVTQGGFHNSTTQGSSGINTSGNGSGTGIGGISSANDSVSDISASTLSNGATSPEATSASSVPGIMSQAGADSVGLSVGALLAGIVGIGLL